MKIMKNMFREVVKNLFKVVCLLGLIAEEGLYAQDIQLHYGLNTIEGSTSVVDESGNEYHGSLLNGAAISIEGDIPVIDLGTNNGYVDMGAEVGSLIASLHDFAIVCKIYIPYSTSLESNGNFIWTFANSNNTATDANGGLFLSAKNTRYAISLTHYANESGIETSSQFPKGSWKTLIYSQKQGIGTIYIDGVQVSSGEINHTPSELGETAYNYLARSSYQGDDYLYNAKIADYRIYDDALNYDQIVELSASSGGGITETELFVKFNFEEVTDTSGTYTGSLENGAQLTDYEDIPVLDLGNDDGYFDFGADFGEVIGQLDSFSLSTNLFIPASTNISQYGNFIWTFANSDNMLSDANGCMFLSAISTRYAITQTDYTDEISVNSSKPMEKGRWINVTYTQADDIGIVYVNGIPWAQSAVSLSPKDIGVTSSNYLGRSCYLADVYLKDALYHNFSIYRGALHPAKIIETTTNDLEKLNAIADSLKLQQAINTLTINNTDSIRGDLVLPLNVEDGIQIAWESSNTNVITHQGHVNRPDQGNEAAIIRLTANLSYHEQTGQKHFDVIVLPQLSDEESVITDLENIHIGGNIHNLRTALDLPHVGKEGSKIEWESGNTDYLNHAGKVLKLSPVGAGKHKVLLHARVTKGKTVAEKDFEIHIAEDDGKSAYLFTYFTGNHTDGEQIRFALSYDGYHYTPLNGGEPVIGSDSISIKKGVRDPHILRSEDGNTYYMVVTDMKSAEGWTSNRGIVMLKSNDLVHWTHSTVHFPDKWPDKLENVLRVWAPQTVYDPQAGKYMVYFSLLTSDGTIPYDKIFYCYANEDFTDLEGDPVFLYDRGSATIDGDIIFNEADSLYHMFYKNEGAGGICKVTAKTLTAPFGQPAGSQWSEPSDNLEQTNQAVEGAGVFRLINSDKWVLMYDVYGAGYYQYCTSDDLTNFDFVMNSTSISARHGTSISITQEEAARLAEAFPPANISMRPEGATGLNIRQGNLTIDHDNRSIEIPVYYGTDLSEYDPGLYASPGVHITPSGAQDFSGNNIMYNFTLGDSTLTYNVKAYHAVNPVVPGFRADPEILYSEKHNRFYLYPTTDGFPGWGGYYFDVFSSPDLVHWTNEGTMLDLSTSQVPWATGNAWAPCIIEKKTGEDSYKYYFYFSGESNGKKIGVATATDPMGPFVDQGAPIISDVPAGAGGGQQIDPDVFTDPVSGQSYLYWGNGYMAVAELSEDMVSIKEESVQVITPEGGSLDTYAFREAVYVFYRNGKYYFLWSVDDTGSPNYHVAYGTSDSPTGPINVADDPIVLIQDPEMEIYGPAHNSILKIPGRDEWYIVYHRINKNHLNDGPGFHREVCIDRLYFNNDETIQPVIPTHEGIKPVSTDNPVVGINTPNAEPHHFVATGNDDAELVNRKVYNLSGMHICDEVKNLTSGLYLVWELYEDGNTAVRKVLVTAN